MTNQLLELLLFSAVLLGFPGLSFGAGVSFTDVAPSLLGARSRVPPDTQTAAFFRTFYSQLSQQFPSGIPFFLPITPQFYDVIGPGPFVDTRNGGIAVLDFDGDGDDDIFVVGPTGSPNLLFRNDFDGTTLSFTEVASQEGIADASFDGSAVCYADVDNDGDVDILVLPHRTKPILYLRRATGGYTKIENAFPATPANAAMQGCTFGDFNGDGKHDVFISVAGRLVNACGGIGAEQHFNLLLMGDGTGVTWTDESAMRGIYPPNFPQQITWHALAYDYDLDGDLDIFVSNDGCLNPATNITHFNLLINNGSGFFTDIGGIPENAGFNRGQWMGASVADLNGDGNLDIFTTNVGDAFSNFAFVPLFQARTRPYFGTEPNNPSSENASYLNLYPDNDPVGTSFGWGSIAVDMDNDGDTDIVYHGDMVSGTLMSSTNPGVFLENDGAGNFVYNNAFEGRKHQRRLVRGVAFGDFNRDGFPDVVTFAPVEYPPANTVTWPDFNGGSLPNQSLDGNLFNPQLGLTRGGTIGFNPQFGPVVVLSDNFTNYDYLDGSITIEISSGNSNKWVRVGVAGTTSTTPRDGFGAVISVRQCTSCSCKWFVSSPKAQIIPIATGGYMSENTRIHNFGMGSRKCAAVQVLWPGGKTNYLIVKAKKTVVIPQLDCDVKDTTGQTMRMFMRCVTREIKRVRRMGIRIPKRYTASMRAGFLFYKKSGYGQLNSLNGAPASTGETAATIALGVGVGLVGSAILCALIVCARRRCTIFGKGVSDRNINHLAREVEVELEESVNGDGGDGCENNGKDIDGENV